MHDGFKGSGHDNRQFARENRLKREVLWQDPFCQTFTQRGIDLELIGTARFVGIRRGIVPVGVLIMVMIMVIGCGHVTFNGNLIIRVRNAQTLNESRQ